jgi:uncharacterized membrane protein
MSELYKIIRNVKKLLKGMTWQLFFRLDLVFLAVSLTPFGGNLLKIF